jgi:hypothetical protein
VPPDFRCGVPFCQTVVELRALYGEGCIFHAHASGRTLRPCSVIQVGSERVYSSRASPIMKVFRLNWTRRLKPDSALALQSWGLDTFT